MFKKPNTAPTFNGKMVKKYALHPGRIISRNDGDEHYIFANELARLYGVDMRQCIIVDKNQPATNFGRDLETFTHLYPDYFGNYILPDSPSDASVCLTRLSKLFNEVDNNEQQR